MPMVVNVERKIWEVEGFRVQFMQHGQDVRGDKRGVPQYTYSAQARNSWTAAEWISKRFSQAYPGYDVRVLNANGDVISNRTTLASIRDAYADEE